MLEAELTKFISFKKSSLHLQLINSKVENFGIVVLRTMVNKWSVVRLDLSIILLALIRSRSSSIKQC
jgi:hypothetical protein